MFYTILGVFRATEIRQSFKLVTENIKSKRKNYKRKKNSK